MTGDTGHLPHPFLICVFGDWVHFGNATGILMHQAVF